MALDPLSLEDYKAILVGPVLSGLTQSIQCGIRIGRGDADALAEQAMASGLGVRWMKSAIRGALDDAIFEAPGAENYRLAIKDGRLACRACAPRGKAGRGRGPAWAERGVSASRHPERRPGRKDHPAANAGDTKTRLVT